MTQPAPPLPRRSRRLPWNEPLNRLSQAAAERARRGLPTLDLTVSNPTRVGIPYPEEELAEALRRGAAGPYEPAPAGLPAARAALAAALSRPGDPVDPADLVLTASTSEAYSFLFKLFADPGEEVLAAVPSYPLLDHLTALDGLALRHFALEPGRRRFQLAPGEIERALTPATRLLVLIHPANPTGSLLSPSEQDAAAALCATHGLPLVSDEVFLEYPLGNSPLPALPPDAAPGAAPPAAARSDVLSFSLGGLSKSAGLPSWKLAWIRAGGPAAARREALRALELIADSYLSVAAPVQHALPEILALAPRLRAAILARLRTNLDELRAAVAGHPSIDLVQPQAGWSAVVRVPRLDADRFGDGDGDGDRYAEADGDHPPARDAGDAGDADEDLALSILERAGVLVQPGAWFDFASDGYLVISLLPVPAEFAAGVRRLLALVSA